ncbi:DDE superfamily endonuclease [Ceratobasidium sp. AG-Ba]|nr:DDE superfamily endonuclease [Ceratobasidium sp. AG-Ba]
MSLDGILHLEIVEGSFTGDLFSDFIDGLLDVMTPFPGPNSVIIMDNCRVHKNPEILERIVARGMLYDFLPPYSPDFNPIESAFSAIKYHIRRHGSLAREALTDDDTLEAKLFLTEAVYSVSAKDAAGWFRMCGYI